MYCPNCHNEVTETQAFCENCGTRLPAAQDRTQPIDAVPGNTAEMPPVNSYQQPVEVVAEPIPGTGTDGAGSYYQQSPSGAAPQPPYNSTTSQASGGQQPYGYNAGPTPPGSGYNAPSMQQPVSNVPFGLSIGALVCALFGLLPVAFILAIVALVMNSNQKKNGVFSTKQTPTFVMSVISIVLSVLLTIALFFLGFAAVSMMEHEGVNVDLGSSGAVTITTPSNSSASATSGTTHSSSSASSASSSAASASSASAAATDGTLSSGSSAAAKGYAGTWVITGIESASINNTNSNVNIDPMALLEDLGLNMTMTLKEDGTLSFEVMGETLPGTWTETAKGVSIKIEGTSTIVVSDNSPTELVAEGDTLVLTDGSDRIVFSRQ